MKKILLTFLVLTTTLLYSQTSLDFDQYVNFMDKSISFEANLLISKGWEIQELNKEKKFVSLKRTHKGVIKEICTFYGDNESNSISFIWIMTTSESVYKRYLNRLKPLGFIHKTDYNKDFKLIKVYENKLKSLNLKIDIEIKNEKLTIFNFSMKSI